MRSSSLLLGAIAFWRSAYAQCEEVVPGQYLGTIFNNTLAWSHPLSDKTFFKIRDPSGQHVCISDPASDLSFLTYISLNSSLQRLANDVIKRLVIVVSGANSDAWNYHEDMLDALTGMGDSQIGPDNVAVLAPFFAQDGQAGTGYPYNPSGLTADEKYPSPAMAWFSTDVSVFPPSPICAAHLLTQHGFSGQAARITCIRLVSSRSRPMTCLTKLSSTTGTRPPSPTCSILSCRGIRWEARCYIDMLQLARRQHSSASMSPSATI